MAQRILAIARKSAQAFELGFIFLSRTILFEEKNTLETCCLPRQTTSHLRI
jgi:hypothetical protein